MDLGIIKSLYVYLISFAVFIAIDFIWLAKLAPEIYRKSIGHLMADKPNLVAAGLFYLIFLFGLLIFVILPALDKGSLKHALLFGALFGLVTYATFDLTSQAVFKDWPTKITIIDLLWGSFLSASVAGVVYVIAKRFIIGE